ncbi:hypothetical protein CE91St45_13100 [Oscillospiraceae bacterium]|nr:hypothetical protein CE91St45_13100 [Oscillospiraceae bacterium]
MLPRPGTDASLVVEDKRDGGRGYLCRFGDLLQIHKDASPLFKTFVDSIYIISDSFKKTSDFIKLFKV